MDMKPLEANGELELIKTTPGSYLGSCRYKLPEDLTDAVYPQLFEKFEKYNIGYFFYIGGNDSMDTVSKLSRYAETVNSEIRFIGIPKTIDSYIWTDFRGIQSVCSIRSQHGDDRYASCSADEYTRGRKDCSESN